ncbi:glyoxalase family protein [Calothrix brevissima NIES-22]|nr:glyoxalase family protein [Calothrix brevissima NIES-22]
MTIVQTRVIASLMEHINLSCKDIDATKNFYQTIFPDWYVRAEGVFNGERWMHFGNNQF